jgi:hypothetical protein
VKNASWKEKPCMHPLQARLIQMEGSKRKQAFFFMNNVSIRSLLISLVLIYESRRSWSRWNRDFFFFQIVFIYVLPHNVKNSMNLM